MRERFFEPGAFAAFCEGFTAEMTLQTRAGWTVGAGFCWAGLFAGGACGAGCWAKANGARSSAAARTATDFTGTTSFVRTTKP